MNKTYDNMVHIRKDNYEFMWPAGDTTTWNIIFRDYVETIKPCIELLQEKQIIKKRAVFQAGGHCGLYPLLLTEFFDMIFTCEPNSLSFHCLVNNCQGSNIVKMNVALGKQNGRVQSKVLHKDNTGMNIVLETTNDIYIPMITIDSLGLTDIDLIEIDLEGYEYNALLGAKNTIETNKPVIILENATDEIRIMLSEMGYAEWKKINRIDSVFVLEKDLVTLNAS
jgi:FkbM family methyltransferase